jgi:hypothetical protein
MTIHWKKFFKSDGSILAMLGKDEDSYYLRYWGPHGKEIVFNKTNTHDPLESFEANDIYIPNSHVSSLVFMTSVLESFYREDKFYDFDWSAGERTHASGLGLS